MTVLEPLEPQLDPALAALADAILIPPFPGPTAPPWLLRALERGLAGVTLFGPNVTGDTASLTAGLRRAAASEPVIAIDEEGGDVTRVAYAAGSPYPGNAALGAVDDPALTRAVYAAIGTDLARLGINVDLAPCADVLAADGNLVVGTRSFGPGTDLVARHVVAAVHGLQSAGVAACAKHFPGHGSTGEDSHLSLATVPGSLKEIRRRDLPPFAAAIAAGSIAVMPGHLRVPELTGSLPATLSPAAVTGLLRGELGFGGVVICDALEMKAASVTFGIPEAAVLAVVAGVDLLCLGRDTDEAMYHAVRAALAGAVAAGRLPGERLEEAAARVTGLRARLAAARDGGLLSEGPGTAGASPGAVHSGAVSSEVGLVAARRALRRSGPVPASLADPLVIEVEPGENIAAGRFTWGFEPWTATERVDPAAGEHAAGELLAAAAGRPLVLAVRDARSVLGLVAAVLAARPDTVIVEMGVPAWTPPPGTAYLATYGASRVCAQAAAEALGLALAASAARDRRWPRGERGQQCAGALSCLPRLGPAPRSPGSSRSPASPRASASPLRAAWSCSTAGARVAGGGRSPAARTAAAAASKSGSGAPPGRPGPRPAACSTRAAVSRPMARGDSSDMASAPRRAATVCAAAAGRSPWLSRARASTARISGASRSTPSSLASGSAVAPYSTAAAGSPSASATPAAADSSTTRAMPGWPGVAAAAPRRRRPGPRSSAPTCQQIIAAVGRAMASCSAEPPRRHSAIASSA